MHIHSVVGHVERHIGHMEKIVREILLDDVALVAETDDEIVDAPVGIDFHDVPEDRAATDLDHRLGTKMGLLTNPGAHTTCKNDGFHTKARLHVDAESFSKK